MKHKTLLAILLALTMATSLHAQSILHPGDSITWQFQLAYDSTIEINHPDQPFGGYVALDYTYLWQGGPLEYRLDFFENATSVDPILSLDVNHLTGLHDQFGAPGYWVPEFSPPPEVWSDFDGILRLTIISGEMKNVTPYISYLNNTTPGLMDYYQAAIIPEPATLTLLALGSLFLVHRLRKS